ncbi:hypothetical protein EDB83DRAFT_2315623 [Lactarius deliciosus]|nr:hypothetical protein EDB83DRAFT_2315623 [Lactarius deliciosus]
MDEITTPEPRSCFSVLGLGVRVRKTPSVVIRLGLRGTWKEKHRGVSNDMFSQSTQSTGETRSSLVVGFVDLGPCALADPNHNVHPAVIQDSGENVAIKLAHYHTGRHRTWGSSLVRYLIPEPVKRAEQATSGRVDCGVGGIPCLGILLTRPYEIPPAAMLLVHGCLASRRIGWIKDGPSGTASCRANRLMMRCVAWLVNQSGEDTECGRKCGSSCVMPEQKLRKGEGMEKEYVWARGPART